MVIRSPKAIRKLNIGIVGTVFLLGIFLKQFYMRQSGSIQIADVLIMLASVLCLTSGKLFIEKTDLFLIFFIALSVGIDLLYYFLYRNNFIMSALYLTYNLVLVLAFRMLMRREGFPYMLSQVLKINLLVQLAVYLSGMGRWFYYRYQGTFNDPNQYGFFIICCLLLISECSTYYHKRVHPLWYLLAGYLVILSSSRGMLLAYLVFLYFAVLLPIFTRRGTVIGVIFSAFFCVFSAIIVIFGGIVLQYIQGNTSWGSLGITLGRFTSSSRGSLTSTFYSFIVDRLLLRCFNAPQYFLYGCGEGFWSRFISISGESDELHSTIISLWYCYGIIPYLFFVKWLWDNMRNSPMRAWGIYLALLLEALTLVNHRQPMFWMIFAMGSYLSRKRSGIEMDKNYTPRTEEDNRSIATRNERKAYDF